MTQLALLGGEPEVRGPLAPFRRIGAEEKAIVNEVLDGGLLSGFYGSWGEEFLGGPYVRRFEADWCRAFGTKHAVSVNSNTSGLIAAAGAIGLSPGDEVIVPPYTMSATAIAPMFYGALPVFVDVEPDTFCLDLTKVEAAISPRTRAIYAVNLFGHPARLLELRALADARGLYLIEDNAQGPFATENGRFAGTIGHIGVFSLNVHKHVQTGEGGICTTDDDRLALRLQMIRNHAESVAGDAGVDDFTNLLGFNFRMTEMAAAVGIAQIVKAPAVIAERVAIAERLSSGIAGLPGLRAPAVRPGCRHVYYVWSATMDPDVLGLPRALLLRALEAEGVPVYGGYVRPLYRLPAFRKRMGIGREGFPFTTSNRVYPDGLCPVTERLHDTTLFTYEICGHDPTPAQLDQIVAAFGKVIENRAALRGMVEA